MLVPQPDGAGFAGVFNDQVSADLGEFDAIRIRQVLSMLYIFDNQLTFHIVTTIL